MPTASSDGFTYNADVFGLVRRMNRFIEEIVKTQSSGVSQTLGFDVERIKTYITSVRGYQEWVEAQPQLDLPETSPRKQPLPAPTAIPEIENESMYDLAVMLGVARDELASSQSSRLSSGLIRFDSSRLTAILDKADSFIDTYILSIDPLDLPESSPNDPMSGGGLGGV